MAHIETCLRCLLSRHGYNHVCPNIFDYFALVIGTSIAEIIGAFWAMRTT